LPAVRPRNEDILQLPAAIAHWLKRKNLFQTFESQDETEIEQEIEEVRCLLDAD